MSFSGLGLSPKADFDPWIDGSKLIVPVGKSLPNQCVACGQPAQKSLKRKFTSSPNTTAFMLGGIVALLAASKNKETFSLAVPLCPQHEGSFKRRRQIALITLCVGIAIFGIAILLRQPPLLFLTGIVVAAGGGVAFGLIKPCPQLRATMINDSLAEFEGASTNFLAQMKIGQPSPSSPSSRLAG